MRISFFVVAVFALALGTVGPVRALPASQIKVTGVVTDANGRPQSGLDVRVECWSSNFQAHSITDKHGAYFAVGREADCRPGTRIKVRVETPTKIGYNYGVVQRFVTINVGLVAKTLVPEYGLIAGMVGACAVISAVAIVCYGGDRGKTKRVKT